MDIFNADPPPIFFILKDITIDDCSWKSYTNDFYSDTNKESDIIYDKIPPIFTTTANHPTRTMLLCWNCSLKFDGFPWFIPMSVTETPNKRKSFTFSCQGNFCSINCVKTYVDTMGLDMNSKIDMENKLKLLYEVVTGVAVSIIMPAPKKTEMLTYGGFLTEDNYREEIANIDITMRATTHILKKSHIDAFLNLLREMVLD